MNELEITMIRLRPICRPNGNFDAAVCCRNGKTRLTRWEPRARKLEIKTTRFVAWYEPAGCLVLEMFLTFVWKTLLVKQRPARSRCFTLVFLFLSTYFVQCYRYSIRSRAYCQQQNISTLREICV